MSRVYYKRIILIAIFLFYIAGCSDDKKRLDTEPVSDDPVKTEKIPFDEATDEPEFGDSEFISATGPKEDNYGEDYDNESNNARTGNNSTENSGSEADSEAAIEEADIYKDDEGWKMMLEGFMEPWKLGNTAEEAKTSIKEYAKMGFGLS